MKLPCTAGCDIWKHMMVSVLNKTLDATTQQALFFNVYLTSELAMKFVSWMFTPDIETFTALAIMEWFNKSQFIMRATPYCGQYVTYS